MNKPIKEVKEWEGFKSTNFVVTYSKEQMIEFAMYCSGHRKHMVENRFAEFENKNTITIKDI
jgi:hypothetical protein